VTDRLAYMWPEIALFVTTCIVMVMGLSKSYGTRKATAIVAGLGVVVAGVLAWQTTPELLRSGAQAGGALSSLIATGVDARAGQVLLPNMVGFAKVLIAIVGLILLLLLAGTVDRKDEDAISTGARTFDPLRSNRAEFYAFFLFSLTGLMLTASADDLIWLFLALELTSLPTYIMVAISTSRNQSREAGVKYFFLGALGAAVFLYGFAMLYGGTGTTKLNVMADVFATQGINAIAMVGILLSIIGLAFKIAAVPMHFYTPDVYQGAASPVSAFLAFVPKTAGMLAILLLVSTFGWNYQVETTHALARGPIMPELGGTALPEPVRLLLWVMAALTMTVGNVLAVLQSSVKRMLAYSSIAHSGYMLVGVIAGPGDGSFAQNGISAVLFYLLSYGVMNVGAFAALASLERKPKRAGEEPSELDHIDDIRGLCKTNPVAGWTMVLSALSLLGLPPLLGFFGKLPLFTSAIHAGEVVLAIVLGINSAIAAFYYLRLAFLPLTEAPDVTVEPVQETPMVARRLAGLVSAGGVVVLSLVASGLMAQTEWAGKVTNTDLAKRQLEQPSAPSQGRGGDAPDARTPDLSGGTQPDEPTGSGSMMTAPAESATPAESAGEPSQHTDQKPH
jgi:NADH-quinone oxidoreductase subunit N